MYKCLALEDYYAQKDSTYAPLEFGVRILVPLSWINKVLYLSAKQASRNAEVRKSRQAMRVLCAYYECTMRRNSFLIRL